MRELGFLFALKFGDDALRQDFTQLDAPLIERVDVPNYALSEYGMFVERYQFAQGFWSQAFRQEGIRRTIALEYAVGDQPLWRTLGFHLLRSLAKSQRFGLRANIGNQHVVMPAKRIESLRKRDEVRRDEPSSLMNQLVERVLTVGSRFAPINWTGLMPHCFPVERHMLAIALHRQLLQIGREPLQVLFVRQNRYGLRAEEIVVPKRQQTHQHRQVSLEGRGAEVLVHLMETMQQRAKIFRANGDHRGEANGRVHRVASADPVPEFEHVRSIDPELCNFGSICRYRDKMLGHRLLVSRQACEGPGARRLGVGHRFQRGQYLRRNDEKRFRRVEILNRFGEIGAIDVGDKAKYHGSVGVVLQGLVCHYRAQVRATDADVDHIPNALAGVALPLAAAQPVGEICHPVEHGLDLGHDVFAVHYDGSVPWRA